MIHLKRIAVGAVVLAALAAIISLLFATMHYIIVPYYDVIFWAAVVVVAITVIELLGMVAQDVWAEIQKEKNGTPPQETGERGDHQVHSKGVQGPGETTT